MTEQLCPNQGVPPPAAGEVVAWLLEKAVQAADADQPKAAGMLTWAAQMIGEQSDSLERRYPQPVQLEKDDDIIRVHEMASILASIGEIESLEGLAYALLHHPRFTINPR